MYHSIITQYRERLLKHKNSVKTLIELFKDKSRAEAFSLTLDSFHIDYSKNLIDDEGFKLLLEMAESAKLQDRIKDLFIGEKINTSENRPALHTALRSQKETLYVDKKNIMEDIHAQFQTMEAFINGIYSNTITSSSGKPFTHVINIGIGGSDLGPKLIVNALSHLATNTLDVQFVSNLDKDDLNNKCQDAPPETTLFIVASKSFGTLETKINAKTAERWLKANNCKDISAHFIAVTTNPDKANTFGISNDRILKFNEWVGGRYSLWSTVGFPIALAIGIDNFKNLLAGAAIMDEHVLNMPLDKNIPVIMGLIDVYYATTHKANNLAIVPYSQRLSLLPEYLSQLMMESNGKSVGINGKPIEDKAGMIVWGDIGTNAQHAFFQFLHQANHFVPIDFIAVIRSIDNNHDHQDKLFANCLAQSKALMQGSKNSNANEAYRFFSGNRPSTTIVLDELNPQVLGMLIAFYEHRTFVQACLWGINPFDQWGVELGKKLASTIIDELENNSISSEHDSSTMQMMQHFLNKRSII